MRKTQALYQQFQESILNGQAGAIAPQIKPHPRMSAQEQAMLYSHGYLMRMRQALEADYPALLAYLGEASFNKLAQGYIRSYPSVFYNLDHYTKAFAPYLASHAPDRFSKELAALEQAIAEVFIAEESAPLPPATFAALTPEAFGKVVPRLRTALRLLALEYPVGGWLDEQRRSESVPPLPEPERMYLCVYRHHHEVQRLQLEEPAFRLLEAIGQGRAVGEALEAVAQVCPQHMEKLAGQLQGWFSQWIEGGVFAAEM